MSNSSRSLRTQRSHHAIRSETPVPQHHKSDRVVLLGHRKPAGIALRELLTYSQEQLRRNIANFDDPVQRQIDTSYLILRLNVTWPGHSRPEVEASKRLRLDGCHCLGQLAIEVAKECQDTLKDWEKHVEQAIAAQRVFELDNLTLVALYHVEEAGGSGTYCADVESIVRE